ncbi:hypothetical protein BPUTEOMOX_2188 [methanotrophic endosymbiont of Bathymodiolus puteoserpentis (Logatchev)]|nr:hypothetical protein BPUTEOMOX_2188 [methanotrophic endosymbiont of Bathymodiolus puteoserpentis (Logatchev)]
MRAIARHVPMLMSWLITKVDVLEKNNERIEEYIVANFVVIECLPKCA